MNLKEAIDHEQIVYRKAFSSETILSERFTAFFDSNCPQVPYWNCAYPQNLEAPLTNSDLQNCLEFYQSKNIDGYVIDYHQQFKAMAFSQLGYLSLNKNQITGSFPAHSDYVIESTTDIPGFVGLVASIFDFSPPLEKAFVGVMQRTLNLDQDHLAIAKLKSSGEPVACLNYFTTASGTKFFMNGGAKPTHRTTNLLASLAEHLVNNDPQAIYLTQTDRPGLRERLFPRFGFSLQGRVGLVKISDALSAITG